ncbi:hypothetical protein F4V57_12430 [Acinetobacter qingfengensis]|uniref:DUF2489 domain-containing protein n=1 Tax=Acinetobacter qingfengensis TaxID=1262585 RepID=A0A1E7QXM2_9GAMM|nr:hypothetical protein [Acinetobacter qingfengensis]KAA8731716.1 hypothetical protein F4V57_12430 [Acinetobacter qingfengensis]OEY91815.1 hypothetical protein BJI46_06680 [Acinetobacter qingfengensis]
MGIFILLLLGFVAFAIYRYRKYQTQREIEEMAADAQAYISSETVELLQRFKKLLEQENVAEQDKQHIQQKFKYINENLFCQSYSEASVREYLSHAEQKLALIRIKLDRLDMPQDQQSNQEFEQLK